MDGMPAPRSGAGMSSPQTSSLGYAVSASTHQFSIVKALGHYAAARRPVSASLDFFAILSGICDGFCARFTVVPM